MYRPNAPSAAPDKILQYKEMDGSSMGSLATLTPALL
jgi:hypothetical protein